MLSYLLKVQYLNQITILNSKGNLGSGFKQIFLSNLTLLSKIFTLVVLILSLAKSLFELISVLITVLFGIVLPR